MKATTEWLDKIEAHYKNWGDSPLVEDANRLIALARLAVEATDGIGPLPCCDHPACRFCGGSGETWHTEWEDAKRLHEGVAAINAEIEGEGR